MGQQLLLPLFTKDTVMITPTLGVNKKAGTVYYYHSGVPIYSHEEEDLNKFRYCTSNFILQGLCKNVDIERAFHVSSDSVRRWKKRLDDEGEKAFFSDKNRKRKSPVMTPGVLDRIQKKLNEKQSVNSIARELGVSEGAIRYQIKKGALKKRDNI